MFFHNVYIILLYFLRKYYIFFRKKKIYSGELCEDSVVSKMEITAEDGKMPPVGTHRVRPCFINAIHGRIQCVPANFVFPMLKSNNFTREVQYFPNNAPTRCNLIMKVVAYINNNLTIVAQYKV